MDIGYEQFKRLLKTYSFGRWDHGALWTMCLHCTSTQPSIPPG